MASSGSFTTGAYTGSSFSRSITVNWSIQSQSIENNTSVIAWSAVGSGTNVNSYMMTGPVNVYINGTQVLARTDRFQLRYGTVVGSGTITVAHDTNGTKTVSMSCNAAIYSGSTNVSGSGNFELTTIPRASTPSLSPTSVVCGKAATTISISRASSSFTHTLTWSCGGLSGTIATGVGTSQSWTPPESIILKFGSATSLSCTINCVTYSGSTNIGSKSVNLTVTKPAASTFTTSVSSVIVGSSFSMTITEQLSSFIHTVTWTAGSLSGTIQTKGTSLTPSYTPPVSFITAMGSNSSITMTIKVETFYGDTSLGYNTKTVVVNKPAASSVSVSPTSLTMGAAMTINITEVLSSFTHDIYYKFANDSAYTLIVSGTTSLAYSWTTVVSTLAPKIPNATSGTGTIRVVTKSGTDTVGEKTATFTATVPADIVPSIDTFSVAEGNTLPGDVTVYVQNQSKLLVTLSGSGAQGSTISKRVVTVASVQYSVTNNNITTNVISLSGDVTVTATITDSRGRTATQTQTVTFVPWALPSITQFKAQRATGDGTVTDDGAYAKVTLNFAFSPVADQNNNAWTVELQANDETEWTTIFTGNDYSLNTNLLSDSVLDVDKTYTMRLTLVDKWTTTTKTIEIPSSFSLIDLRNTGKGIAFGKASEADKFECALPAEFTGTAEFLGDVIAIALMQRIYPIGCIYMSADGANPADTIGFGEWTAWGAGRVPVGVGSNGTTNYDTAEATGGAESVALSTVQMPAHTHTSAAHTHTSAAHTHSYNAPTTPTGSTTPGATGSTALTVDQMPSHTHNMNGYGAVLGSGSTGWRFGSGGTSTATGIIQNTGGGGGHTHTSAAHTHTVSTSSATTGSTTPAATGSTTPGATGSTGTGSAHENRQPYITCYMWKRVA
ncbi:MAG: DUF859 family phage minor structural protein [Lachnospiraceae bacterium]|nr:DUF859 family phage minor structural protein [Lachnospiraceae bacterium]